MDYNRRSTDPKDAHESEDGLLNIGADEFAAAFGESLEKTLNIDNWRVGDDIAAAHERLEREITESIAQENDLRDRIRNELFPLVFSHPQAPRKAGYYQASPAKIESVQRGLLFNGAVEACNGISMVHDSLALTVAQIGVSAISYRGDSGTWVQRLFRRDLRLKGESPIAEVFSLLQRRAEDPRAEGFELRDVLSKLSRRAIMTFAEHSVLLHKCSAPWRMAHGTPTPHELLTGAGLMIEGEMPLLSESLKVWRELLVKHKKWIFVLNAPAKPFWQTLGSALHPLEYAFVDTPLSVMSEVIKHLPRPLKDEAKAFVDDIGPRIVVGIYRASKSASPRVFYAHEDCAHDAALIVIADSALREHRGSPLLLDLASQVCQTSFGAGDFEAVVQQAYVQAGAPFHYFDNREVRL
ncbi:MAG TPA: hypothetical protein VFS21_12080 [Roseiflexaceae bacterium]|nr:hypothetical protein [Roseiflexaceae bacterium]